MEDLYLPVYIYVINIQKSLGYIRGALLKFFYSTSNVHLTMRHSLHFIFSFDQVQSSYIT